MNATRMSPGGLPPKVALTMSNLIVGLLALAGANIYLEAGLIDTELVTSMLPGVVIGSLIGSKLMPYFSNRMIQLFFTLMLFILGVEMLTSGYWRFR